MVSETTRWSPKATVTTHYWFYWSGLTVDWGCVDTCYQGNRLILIVISLTISTVYCRLTLQVGTKHHCQHFWTSSLV